MTQARPSTSIETEPRPTRQRIIEAAAVMTAELGWSRVTMGALAEEVGVSRQTVYNEVHSKDALAEAMIMRELLVFLAAVEQGFDRYPYDAPQAARAATRGVLELAADNDLLRAVVSGAQGADSDLLPLLTTRSESLLTIAMSVVHDRLRAYALALTPSDLTGAVDMIVRTVLGHVVQPSGSPRATADAVGRAAERLLPASG